MPRRPFRAVLLIAMSASATLAQDFRGLQWGASIESIGELQGRQVERREHPDFKSIVTYRGHAEGQDALVMFFEDDDGRLAQGAVGFLGYFEDPNGYVDRYEEVKALLTQRHGVPVEEKALWSDETLRGKPSQRGRAVLEGHVAHKSVWRTPESVIQAGLWLQDGEVLVGITYTSLDWLVSKRGEQSRAEIERTLKATEKSTERTPAVGREAPPERAKIYLFRPFKLAAAAAKPLVTIKGPGVRCHGVLKVRQYIEVEVDATGSKSYELEIPSAYTWQFPGISARIGPVEPGGEYFVRLSVNLPAAFVDEISVQEGRKLRSKLKPVQLRCE